MGGEDSSASRPLEMGSDLEKSVGAHRPVLDRPADDLGRLRVHADVAGAVDHAVELDGLRELGERLGSLLREDGLDLAHFVRQAGGRACVRACWRRWAVLRERERERGSYNPWYLKSRRCER